MASEPSVEYQLGFLGMSWTRVVQLKSDLFDRAALMHHMGAVTKAAIISDEAKDSGKRLCFSADDNNYWIEPIPSHHADWDMTEDEWEELRSVLWWSGGTYTEKLKKNGKLGTTVPLRLSAGGSAGGGGGNGGAGGSAYGYGAGGGWVSAGGYIHPRYGPPMPVQHDKQYPVDSQEDAWRCDGCGMIYKVTSGFAICPNDPDPPTGGKVGGGPVIA